MKPYKLAIIAPVPFYYHVPLYRKLADSPEIDLMVYYCSDETLTGADVKKTYYTTGQIADKEYLMEGYRHAFLKNYSLTPSFLKWPFGLVNFGIFKEIKNGNYDAVVLQSWTNATWWIAFFTCVIFKTPVLFMTDSNVLSEPSKPGWKKLVKKILIGDLLFKNASGFLTSGTANEEFYKYYGVTSQKIIRVPFSWGYDWFLSKAEKIQPQRAQIRDSFNIKKEDFVFLYVGRLASEKLPLALLEAYHKADIPNKKLLIVGGGPLRAAMEEQIKTLQIPNVHFMGFQPRESLFHFYVVADAFVLPSKDETWGIVVNEAMCFGLPILASDRVGVGVDLVRHHYNGFISPAGDILALSSDLEKIAGLPLDQRALFGARSKEMIIQWIEGIDATAQVIKMLKLIKKS